MIRPCLVYNATTTPSLCDFYMAALGGLSGLSTEYATAIGVIAVVMNQLHFQNIYSALDLLRTAYDGTEYLNVLRRNSLSVLWLYRLVPLLWMIGLSIVLETGQRREFQVRLQLKRQKDLRIEQLKREKERADWDRNLLARNSSPRGSRRRAIRAFRRTGRCSTGRLHCRELLGDESDTADCCGGATGE